MFINNFDPVAFEILSIEIRWYSLAYIFGILLGWHIGRNFFLRDNNLKQKFDDYITYVILGIIIGGRLGYILFIIRIIILIIYKMLLKFGKVVCHFMGVC